MITLRAMFHQENSGVFHVEAHAPTDLVERTYVSGWTLKPKDRVLVTRLVCAIEAGAALTDLTVKTDVLGKTYVASTSTVLGRTLNADLKRLGF